MTVMLSMGLHLGYKGILQLWREPPLLARCIVAAFVIVPLSAFLLFRIFGAPMDVRIGIWVMAITPGAPLIYRRVLQGHFGDMRLAGSFQATMALLAVFLVPVWLQILGMLAGRFMVIPAWEIIKQIAFVQMIPIVIGAFLQDVAPRWAREVAAPLRKAGNAGILIMTLGVLVVGGPRIYKGAALVTLFCAFYLATAGILAGHLLGGPDLKSRITIGNANPMRNPGLAYAVAASNYPDQNQQVLVTIATYVIVMFVATAIYTKLISRKLGAEAEAVEPPQRLAA